MDRRCTRLSERALSAWRGLAVGIVFQFFQLLPTLTAVENVMLPMDFCKRWPRARAARAGHGPAQALWAWPIRLTSFQSRLSGGQQQRVAVARALANAPALLLADEPTGNLDSRNASVLLELLAELVAEGQTVVMVTHERSALRQVGRCLTLVDGRFSTTELQ